MALVNFVRTFTCKGLQLKRQPIAFFLLIFPEQLAYVGECENIIFLDLLCRTVEP